MKSALVTLSHQAPSYAGIRVVLVVWASAVTVWLTGCSTGGKPPPGGSPSPGAVTSSPSPRTATPSTQGIVREYDITQEAAWEIAKTIFRWEESGRIEEQRSKGYMVSSVGANAVSSGTVIGVWIEAGQQPQTSKITVLTQRRFLSSGALAVNEMRMHQRFAQALGLIKQGKVLPKTAPPLPV